MYLALPKNPQARDQCGAKMARQAKLFEDQQENKDIATRFKQTFADQKIARHLMSADSWERETIAMLMDEDDMTLYEAIAMCIKYPAERE